MCTVEFDRLPSELDFFLRLAFDRLDDDFEVRSLNAIDEQVILFELRNVLRDEEPIREGDDNKACSINLLNLNERLCEVWAS